jgi:two-component system cell cycle sensor histidine kinase/response regulator CckA
MDIVLKGSMTGIEAATKIKDLYKIPVIYLTAFGEDDIMQRAKMAEPYGYILKPFQDRELHIAIEIALYKKQAEARIQKVERWLANVLKSVGDAVITSDNEGRITFMNTVAEKLTSWKQEEALGKKLTEILNMKDMDLGNLEKHLVESVITEGLIINLIEDRLLVARNGIELSISDSVAPLRTEDGETTGSVLIFRDISERKRLEVERLLLEQQYQQAQKLESLGILAGGIAHDFNNILAIIICNCSLIQQRPTMVAELVPEIDTAAKRAAELCRQMLVYAGKAQPIPTKFNPKTLVEEMCKLLKATINQNVSITLDLSAEIPSIRADASQIRQVVMNLIINASEAIGTEQGEVGVSLAIEDIEAGQGEKGYLGKVITPGSYICLKVTDSGCGMDEETKLRIFEPFYTTKFTGRGLGMSAVLGIIRAHNGALQLTSQQGFGTTFTVYLPVQSSEPVGELLPLVSLMPWQGDGTILLVEDEPQLSMVAKALLQALGFSVFVAENGQVALEMYQKHSNYITLVLTDIGMPVMNGYELIRELKKLNPELPIIVSSGFGDAEVTSRIHENIAGVVGKPYSFDQLREVLKRVLEGAKEAKE